MSEHFACCRYGIMGIGAVCHTLNPRLSPADIMYIADHGQDKLILADLTFLPILGRIYKQLPQLQGIVVLTDRWAGERAGALFAAVPSSPLWWAARAGCRAGCRLRESVCVNLRRVFAFLEHNQQLLPRVLFVHAVTSTLGCVHCVLRLPLRTTTGSTCRSPHQTCLPTCCATRSSWTRPCHMRVASTGRSWMKTAPQASATPGAVGSAQAASG